MLGEHFFFSGQNNVGRFFPHTIFHQRHGNARQVFTKRLKAEQHRTFKRTEESRHTLQVENVCQLIRNACGRERTKRLVRHFDERRFIRWLADHTIEFRLLPPLLRSLQLLRSRKQLSCNADRTFGIRITGRVLNESLDRNFFVSDHASLLVRIFVFRLTPSRRRRPRPAKQPAPQEGRRLRLGVKRVCLGAAVVYAHRAIA